MTAVRRYARACALAVLLFGGSQFAAAQVTLTPDQLRAVQQLSPAQRAAILQSLGGGQPDSAVATAQDEDVEIDETTLGLESEAEEEIETELRIEGDDTVVVTTRFKEEFETSDVDEFLADINRIRLLGSHVFRLDKSGILELPGIAAVPLAGLSAEEIAVRLSSEPLLALLDIEVQILPVMPTGTDALQPFGYSLFDEEYAPFGVQPIMGMPVPRDYVIGPGDVLKFQVYGDENYEVNLTVNQDGTINFPRTGPRGVAGLTFAELKEDIEQRVSEQLIGTSVAVSMAELRSMRVFVVGDVKRPGAYAMSALAQITNALFASGGITEVGSLRRIQVKRNNTVVRNFDIYDLLLRGDSSNDTQLRADDVVFVPPVEDMVGIDGEVKRPAMYELRSERVVGDLIELAGGLLPTADRRIVQLDRVTGSGGRRVETLDLVDGNGLSRPLQAGDLVRVFPLKASVEDAVFLSGHVERATSYEWRPGMTLTDLLPQDTYLKPKADLSYLLIRREQGSERQAVVLSADLKAARAAPKSAADPRLENRDRVTVFELGVSRSAAVAAILAELEAQATRESPLQAVRVSGHVRAPGSYPLEANMRISDLLRAGGGLAASAFATEAELTRYFIDGEGERETELIKIDLSAVRTGDSAADLPLYPYDYLSIRETPEWKEQLEVELIGEVRFPGVYPVRQGETLTSVIERAGGLTDLAFPEGSLFTREGLKEREQEQIEQLTKRLEADLARLSLQVANDPQAGLRAQQASSLGQSLLEQLRDTEPTGRLVIDLPAILRSAGRQSADIVLRDGDTLLVPGQSQEVTVLGEVQYATSHFYDSKISRDGYIQLSGGTTVNADKKRIYVVRANGAVQASGGSRWFRGGKLKIEPGDTVVVPLDTDRLPSLTQWASITQIVYNLALAAAAINSF